MKKRNKKYTQKPVKDTLYLFAGRAPIGDAVQINVFYRVGLTVLYTIAMTFITAGIGKIYNEYPVR